MRPLLRGMEGDACQMPALGYMLNGTVRMHTPAGPKDYTEGQAFYWHRGTRPKALVDVESVDFSPTAELTAVLAHVSSQGAGA